MEALTRKDLEGVLPQFEAKILDNVEERMKKFDFSSQESDEAKKKAEKRAEALKFFKAMASGDYATVKEMSDARAKTLNEGTGSEGGYLVPEGFDRQVLRYTSKFSQLRNLFTVVPMTEETLRLNELTAEPVVTTPGELGAISGSDLAFGEPVLKAIKFTALTAWSNEIQEDAETDPLALMAERIGRAIAKKEQEEMINRNDPDFMGLINVSGTSVRQIASGTSFSNVDLDDLAGMTADLGEIDEMDLEESTFIMSRSVYTHLLTKKNPTTTEYYLPAVPTSRNMPQLWGVPVVIVPGMPTMSDSGAGEKFIALSAWKRHAFIGDKAGLRVKVLSEGTVVVPGGTLNLATQDAQALRAVKRTAFTTALNGGIIWLVTKAE